ncbi:MAG TPA: hypothetical protein V6D28_09740 [Leptolyngbyaceae cyanobacterium]
MKTTKLTKQDYTRLGTFSLALALGTACSVLGVSVVGVPVAVIGTLLASIAGGIVTNEVSPILTSQETDKDTLRNNDLTKIVGKSIAAVIVAVADSKQFDKETETSLRKMAELAEEEWENIVKNLPGEFAPIEESQLTEFFTNRPEYFNKITALDVSLWQSLLIDLQQQANVNLPQFAIDRTANDLHQIFPKALREVLKEDFQADGKGFAGIVLDLFAVMRSQITQNHDILLQNFDNLDKRLESLTQKSQDEIAAELKTVAGQIDSGFQEALQQMGVVQTGINELLFGSKAILHSLEDLNKQSQQRHEELVRLIENSSDPEIVQIKYWENLQKQAKSPRNWLEFLTEDGANQIGLNRGAYLELPPPSEMPPTIAVNKKLWMAIDLEYPNYQLLLFNRSKQGTVLHCPSFGYAIDAIMNKPPFLLPQKYSWAGKTGQKFIFKETGKEEFLAIVLEKHLNLSWLTPKREEALPEWNAERIKELFEELEQQGNWQVFYQSFEVVE